MFPCMSLATLSQVAHMLPITPSIITDQIIIFVADGFRVVVCLVPSSTSPPCFEMFQWGPTTCAVPSLLCIPESFHSLDCNSIQSGSKAPLEHSASLREKPENHNRTWLIPGQELTHQVSPACLLYTSPSPRDS
eukprot:TRINITY_DN55468_c0_g1_i2.p2 TRINITY_DN55468_c0_g1~~TRINITY_DN55468_c0_g1_i2.p2  ORF type:complete len:134 (+),score=11.68 TRINITY_DN55468_c0_g1_i2:487-888(+)